MANRYFPSQFVYSFEQMPVALFLKAAVSTSGAITLDAVNSKGIASITKEATAGQYTIVLQDIYKGLLSLHIDQQINAGALVAPVSYMLSETVATQATRSIVVQFQAADGSTETNPADTTTLRMRIDLRNK